MDRGQGRQMRNVPERPISFDCEGDSKLKAPCANWLKQLSRLNGTYSVQNKYKYIMQIFPNYTDMYIYYTHYVCVDERMYVWMHVYDCVFMYASQGDTQKWKQQQC